MHSGAKLWIRHFHGKIIRRIFQLRRGKTVEWTVRTNNEYFWTVVQAFAHFTCLVWYIRNAVTLIRSRIDLNLEINKHFYFFCLIYYTCHLEIYILVYLNKIIMCKIFSKILYAYTYPINLKIIQKMHSNMNEVWLKNNTDEQAWIINATSVVITRIGPACDSGKIYCQTNQTKSRYHSKCWNLWLWS